MVDWANLNKTLSYVNDGLQFGLDLITPKKEGQTLGDKVSYAGINLFGNSMATRNAAELREATGSNLGYFAKNQANGDGAKALQATTEANLWTWQTGMMYGNMYGMGCCSSMGMWDTMMPGGTFGPGYGARSFPGSSTFRSSFFRNGWFG